MIELEEGDRCPCGGTMHIAEVSGCTCHCGHPPCSACVNNPLICDTCYCTLEDLQEEQSQKEQQTDTLWDSIKDFCN